MNLDNLIRVAMQEQGDANSVYSFLINICVTILLSIILEVAYVKLGNSSTKSRLYANNFMLLSVTTTMVINFLAAFAIGGSAVALSLGLLGVLSVVRFRAAIKDPEELAFLFLAITIGLGSGIGLITFTTLGFTLIIIALALRKMVYDSLASEPQKISKVDLTVSGGIPEDVDLEQMTRVLEKYCERVKVRGFQETDLGFEAEFRLWYYDLDDMMQAKDAITGLYDGMEAGFTTN